MHIAHPPDTRRAEVTFEPTDDFNFIKNVCIGIHEAFQKRPKLMPKFRIGKDTVKIEEVLLLFSDETRSDQSGWTKQIVIVFDLTKKTHRSHLKQVEESMMIRNVVSLLQTRH